MDISKKLVPAIMAIILVIAMCPTLALAAPDAESLAPGAALTTQDESDASGNPYPKYNDYEGGQIACTWYVWDYVYRNLGIKLPGTWGRGGSWGDAKSWYAKAGADPFYDVGSAPRANSIAVYDATPGNQYGHVEFVTAANGSNMTVNTGGYAGDASWPNPPGIREGWEKTGVVGQNDLIGFIYLVQDNPMTVTASDKSLKASAVKSAARKVSSFAVADAVGAVTFSDAGSSKNLTIASDGKVMVKKGTPEGSYKAKVTVHAKGNAQYKAKDVSAEATIKVVSAAATYKVKFVANGGKGTMKAQAIKRGKQVALKANTFTRSGYKFVGWNTKANGKGKSYKDKAKVKNLAKAGKTVTLYAQWKKASKASYIVENAEYRLTIPRAWRGKVVWSTSSYELSNPTSKWKKAYTTSIYLKGHKGDARYLLAKVQTGITGFGIPFFPVLTKATKTQNEQYVMKVGVTSTNWAVIYNYDIYTWHELTMPTNDQKKMLSMLSGGAITYSKARKYAALEPGAIEGMPEGQVIPNYLKKIFKDCLKVFV